MLPYRSEIRNSPKEQTIKIYVKDLSKDEDIKNVLSKMDGIKLVEIQKSLSRNRVDQNITIYRNEGEDINVLKTEIDKLLDQYFSLNSI